MGAKWPSLCYSLNMRERAPAPEDGLCTLSDCIEEHYAKGFCKRHYYQNKRGKLGTSIKKGEYRYNLVGDRWCNYHQDYHDPEDFGSNIDNSDGLKGDCREACKWRGILWRYGITEKQFKQKLKDQNGLCPICLVNEATHIDHNHNCCPTTYGNRRTCGKCVRDILCLQCNTTLGRLESEGWMDKAVDYIERHRT